MKYLKGPGTKLRFASGGSPAELFKRLPSLKPCNDSVIAAPQENMKISLSVIIYDSVWYSIEEGDLFSDKILDTRACTAAQQTHRPQPEYTRV